MAMLKVHHLTGHNLEQLARTVDEISAGNPALRAIPTDRPHLGMVVTLEPYYMTNSIAMKDVLPKQSIPTMAAAARELEHFVACARELDGPSLLLDVYRDSERSTWDLGRSLPRTASMRNPLLDEAWTQLPWKRTE